MIKSLGETGFLNEEERGNDEKYKSTYRKPSLQRAFKTNSNNKQTNKTVIYAITFSNFYHWIYFFLSRILYDMNPF